MIVLRGEDTKNSEYDGGIHLLADDVDDATVCHKDHINDLNSV